MCFSKIPMSIAFGLLILWFVTLGIFAGSRIESTCENKSDSSFKEYKSGATDSFGNATAIPNKHGRFGIPYLFQYEFPKRPFNLSIVIHQRTGFVPSKIVIEKIVSKKGEIAELKMPHVVKYSPAENPLNQYSPNIVLKECLREGNLWELNVKGRFENESGEFKEFESTLLIRTKKKRWVTIGWIKWLYYDQF